MIKQTTDIPVMIPPSIYQQALEYLPSVITDSIFELTSTQHAGIMASSSLELLDAQSEATKARLIEEHYSSSVSDNVIYLPLVCEIFYLTFLMFNRMLTPSILLFASVLTLVVTGYLSLKLKNIRDKHDTAIIVLRNIELLTALTVNDRLRKYLVDALTQNDSVLSLARNDAEEIRVRYEGAINYFYTADPTLTNKYIGTMSQTPIRVLHHETLQ